MKRAWMAGVAVGAVSALGLLISASANAQEVGYPGTQPYPEGNIAGPQQQPQPYSNAPQVQPAPLQQPQQQPGVGAGYASPGPQGLAAPVAPSQQIRQPQTMEQAPMPNMPMQTVEPRQQRPVQMGVQTGVSANAQPGMGMGASCTLSDVSQGVQDRVAGMLARMDGNDDGMISRPELLNAAQQFVGGVFFRADENHDGRLTPAEAHAARAEILSSRPMVGLLAEAAKDATSSQGMKRLASYLDVNQDKTLDMAEVNRATMNGVDAIFSFADTNHDDELSVPEINAGVSKLSENAARTAFRSADANRDGTVSREEFAAAMQRPEQALFGSMDKNGDGTISQQEAIAAEKSVGHTLGLAPLTEEQLLQREEVQPQQPSYTQPGLQQLPQAPMNR